MQHRNAVHIHQGGRTIVGWYSVDHDCRLVTVECGTARKTTQLGLLSPESAARLLLRDLVQEGKIAAQLVS